MKRYAKPLLIIVLALSMAIATRCGAQINANTTMPLVLAILLFPTGWRKSPWHIGMNVSLLVVWAAIIWNSSIDFAHLPSGTPAKAQLAMRQVDRDNLIFDLMGALGAVCFVMFFVGSRRKAA